MTKNIKNNVINPGIVSNLSVTTGNELVTNSYTISGRCNDDNIDKPIGTLWFRIETFNDPTISYQISRLSYRGSVEKGFPCISFQVYSLEDTLTRGQTIIEVGKNDNLPNDFFEVLERSDIHPEAKRLVSLVKDEINQRQKARSK